MTLILIPFRSALSLSLFPVRARSTRSSQLKWSYLFPGPRRGGSFVGHGLWARHRRHSKGHSKGADHVFVFGDDDYQGGQAPACELVKPRPSRSVDKVKKKNDYPYLHKSDLSSSRRYSTVSTLLQYYLFMPLSQKDVHLVYLANSLAQNSIMVFTRTVHDAQRYVRLLTECANHKLGLGSRLCCVI